MKQNATVSFWFFEQDVVVVFKSVRTLVIQIVINSLLLTILRKVKTEEDAGIIKQSVVHHTKKVNLKTHK